MERVNGEPQGVSPLRITLVISSLGSGGAERVMATLANYWARNEKNVTLITLAARDADFYTLDSRVNRVALDAVGASQGAVDALRNNWNRTRLLRNAILASQPSVVVGFTDATNVLVLLALRRSGIPTVVSERIDPRFHRIGNGWNLLRRLTYRWADALVVQTAAVSEWAKAVVGEQRVAVIPNPLVVQEGPADAAVADAIPRRPFVAAMGRLDPQKGFDLLLTAFASAGKNHPEWSLVILGEGNERGRLEKQAAELGISGRVHLPGRVQQPLGVLQQAEVFVLSSRYEGFPNALLEAMSCGRAVVSFDCASGPAEFVSSNENGILVPNGDVAALAQKLDLVMSDPALRERLGNAAKSVRQRFAVATIAQQWESLFARIAARG